MNKTTIQVEANRVRAKISPYIYGHFIEHLGRCINGGIWAEKIQNGKLIGNDPQHNGVIYPWEPWGEFDRSKIYRMHDNTHFFVGIQSQKIEIFQPRVRGGIIQKNIDLEKTKYLLRLIVKGNDIQSDIKVSLQEGRKILAEVIISEKTAQWKEFSFQLQPQSDLSSADLIIEFEGPGILWIGYVSLMPLENTESGMRKDVLQAIHDLKPPIIRWPGGNFASGYHWMDGIGSREKRPPRWDQAWNSWEPNDFGTDEFIEFCRLVESEPYICVNTGTGTPEEAKAWVEYCNGFADTEYGSLRVKNGHIEPYNVKYWGVGNETYGNWQTGHVDAESYGRHFLEFAKTMKSVDPNIELIAVGVNESGFSSGIDFYPWNEKVLSIIGNEASYYSAHHYVPGPELLRDQKERPTDDSLYYPIVGFPEEMKEILSSNIEVLDEIVPEKAIKIAYDEWNVWIDGNEKNGLEENYLLRDGLYAAGMFHAFFQYSDRIKIANIAQLVNVLGVITTNSRNIILTPLYHAFKLYRDHFFTECVECKVSCDGYKIARVGTISTREKIPYLDASASIDEQKNVIALAVINRHKDLSIQASTTISGYPLDKLCKVFLLTGPHSLSKNTILEPDQVKITENVERFEIINGTFSYLFKPHSITILHFQVV